MPDEWDQYARKSSGGDEWDQYARKSQPEHIQGLPAGQQPPGMHAPKVNMQEQDNALTTGKGLASSFGSAVGRTLNPVPAVQGAVEAGKHLLTHPLQVPESYDADKQFNQADQFINTENKKPTNARTIAEGVGSNIGEYVGNGLGIAAGEGLSRVKPPIGARLSTEEGYLDAAGVRPDAAKVNDSLANVRGRNMTSNGVPINEPMDSRFGKASNQVMDLQTRPGEDPKFSDYSSIKKDWQKEGRNGGFFDSPEVKSGTKAIGQSSGALNETLRQTPGAEEWAKLNDKASRGHSIDTMAGRAGQAIGYLAPPILGVEHLGPLGGAAGLGIAHPLAKLGQTAGYNASKFITSGKAANLIKPAAPAVPLLTRKPNE